MRIEVLPPTSPSPPARELVAAAQAGGRAVDPGVVTRWARHLERLGARSEVHVNLAHLARGASCVVTGQQAGLLTGPLLTVLKAARAVSLARELSAASARPVVPVFWVAADDHDLAEIHHTFVANERGEPHKLSLELGATRGAAGEVAVPIEKGDALVDELWRVAAIDPKAFDPAPFRPRAGDTLSTWCSRCLLEMFGEHGLVPFEPSLFGAAARPLFDAALREDDAVERALTTGFEQLRSRGVEPPLQPDPQPPLFVIERGARLRVHRRGNEFFVGDPEKGGRATSRAALLELAREGVPRLSANVALRPVLQAELLPTIAAIDGPTEARYAAQLEPLHEFLRAPFPTVVPRPQATLLTTSASRALRKLGLSAKELFARLDGSAQPVADHAALVERGRRLRGEVATFVDELLATSGAVKSAAERRATQLLQSFDATLERATSAFTSGDETAARRLAELTALVRPRGRPQERSLVVLPFLAEQGRALIDALFELRGEPDESGVVPHSLLIAE